MLTTRAIRVTVALLLALLVAQLPVSFTYDLRFTFAEAGRETAGQSGPWIGDATRGVSQLRFTPRLLQGNLDEGLEHIAYRHWHSSGFSGVSRFGKDVGLRDLSSFIQQAARTGTWETQGLSHVIEANLGRTIGTTATGAETSWIRIVSGKQGQVVTAYPIPGP